jgi:hypothetical protein
MKAFGIAVLEIENSLEQTLVNPKMEMATAKPWEKTDIAPYLA